MFVGRGKEVARLRAELASASNTLAIVSGPRGVGKTSLIRASLAGTPFVFHAASPLAGDLHFTELAESLRGWPPRAPSDRERGHVVRRSRLPSDDPVDRWGRVLELIDRALDEEGSSPGEREPAVTLVIDDAGYLAEAHRAFGAALVAYLRRAAARGYGLNVLLAGSPSSAFDRLTGPESPLADLVTLRLPLEPLSFRHASRFFAAYSPTDRVRAYAIFGGMPSVLETIEDSRPLRDNVISLVLGAEAPLRKRPLELLHAEVQSIGRYAGVLSALSHGARRWGEILSLCPDFPSGGQLTPYIRRLEGLGLIEARRSLDDEADSRNRRYEIADRFHHFWFRFVLPHRVALELGRGEEVWEEVVRPGLDPFVAAVFPAVCRQYLHEHATELFGLPTREVGSIWRADGSSEIPVAGTLEEGAVCYGTARWVGDETGTDALDQLRKAIRMTRYGVARMTRNQLVFSGAPFSAELRGRAATDQQVRLVGIQSVVGDGATD